MKKNILYYSIISLILAISFPSNHAFAQGADFPYPIITSSNNPSPGYFFLGNIPASGQGNEYGNYLMVIDNDGQPAAFRKVGDNLDKIPLNFMQSPSGKLVHMEKTPTLSAVFVSDTALGRIDSIPNNNPLIIQPYFALLSNGHYLIVHFIRQFIDLSTIIEGGNPNILLMSSDVFELDKDKNIVFYWRDLDYVNITDTYLKDIDPNSKSQALNYIHTNNVYQDDDGNLLMSNRHFSDIIKINHLSGDIMWRLGGRNNEFEFIDEHEENAPTYFSYQHDIRRNPNGNITLFDNGNQHVPPYSRAVEYELDEVNKTAKLVWEYVHEDNIYASANGSVHRQPNGNTVISWGEASLEGAPAITEVTPDKKIALEMYLPENFKSLRSTKYPWTFSNPSDKVNFEILKGNSYNFKKNDFNTCVKMKINELEETFYPTVFVEKYDFSPMDPEFNEVIPPVVFPKRLNIYTRGMVSYNVEMRFNAECLGINKNTGSYKVYFRSTNGKGIFTQLPTIFDETSGDLVVNTDQAGEFLFGIPETEAKPGITNLIAPKFAEKVNQAGPVKLIWSPHGYFTGQTLQIANDADFNTKIVDDSLLKSITYTMQNVEAGRKYYWRVRSRCGELIGDWSETFEFVASGSYVEIKLPVGGEEWAADSTMSVIRWEKNVKDALKIELLRDGEFFALIKDSVTNTTGAFGWHIPKSIPEDSTYKIRITSVVDNKLISESPDNFTIKPGISGVDYNTSNVLEIYNYPNPFGNQTNFHFKLHQAGYATLKVYSIEGSEFATVFSQYFEKGEYKYNWLPEFQTPGIYFYKLSLNGIVKTDRLIILK